MGWYREKLTYEEVIPAERSESRNLRDNALANYEEIAGLEVVHGSLLNVTLAPVCRQAGAMTAKVLPSPLG